MCVRACTPHCVCMWACVRPLLCILRELFDKLLKKPDELYTLLLIHTHAQLNQRRRHKSIQIPILFQTNDSSVRHNRRPMSAQVESTVATENGLAP